MQSLISVQTPMLSKQQKAAIAAFESFISPENSSSVFTLKGYAGTGKTTLIVEMVRLLRNKRRHHVVTAPTGRAAKVIREKLKGSLKVADGEIPATAKTIHSVIYNLEGLKIKQNSDDDTDKDFKYIFPLRVNDEHQHITIIDEASMVSDTITEHEMFQFGSGKLFSDLLIWARLRETGNKIVFIGDPAQLPPVGDPVSRAFSKEEYQNRNIQFEQFELTHVFRQAKGGSILDNATALRALLEKEKSDRVELTYTYDDCFKSLKQEDLIDTFVEMYPKPAIGSGVFINFRNRDCLALNQAVRERYFSGKKKIQAGDLLLVVKNRKAASHDEPLLFNGDLIQVVDVFESEVRYTPVFIDKEKKVIALTYRDCTVRIPDFDRPVHIKIIESMLEQEEGSLSVHEMKAMHIDFQIRFKEQNTKRAFPIAVDSAEYKEILMHDPYINALQVKYGYALTCHKAQGGEWDSVIVNFDGRTGLSDDHLRWSYTAITRAKEKLYALGAPNITHFSGLRIEGPTQLGKIPEYGLSFGLIPDTPFHGNEVHPGVKELYHDVTLKLKETPHTLRRVESRPWLEMYFIQVDGSEVRFDARYDKAGMVKPFTTAIKDESTEKIAVLLNSPAEKQFSHSYDPSMPSLGELYGRVRMVCDESSIQIASVTEFINQYHVHYFFYKEGCYADLKVYFKKNGAFSYGKFQIADVEKTYLFRPLLDSLAIH